MCVCVGGGNQLSLSYLFCFIIATSVNGHERVQSQTFPVAASIQHCFHEWKQRTGKLLFDYLTFCWRLPYLYYNYLVINTRPNFMSVCRYIKCTASWHVWSSYACSLMKCQSLPDQMLVQSRLLLTCWNIHWSVHVLFSTTNDNRVMIQPYKYITCVVWIWLSHQNVSSLVKSLDGYSHLQHVEG